MKSLVSFSALALAVVAIATPARASEWTFDPVHTEIAVYAFRHCGSWFVSFTPDLPVTPIPGDTAFASGLWHVTFEHVLVAKL